MKNGDLIHHVYFLVEPTRSRRMTDVCDKRCRTVVKKERFEEQWPEDPEFKAFADLLANSVQKALFEGFEIKPAQQCGRDSMVCCPLGALPSMREAGRNTPAGHIPGLLHGLAFAIAFDDGEGDTSNPYVRLALAYRKRFVKEKGE